MYKGFVPIASRKVLRKLREAMEGQSQSSDSIGATVPTRHFTSSSKGAGDPRVPAQAPVGGGV